MKTGKSAGPDEIPVEMFTTFEDDGVDLVWETVNKIYETGNFPEDMLKSVFFALPKVPGTLDCSNHMQNHKLDGPHSQSSTEDRSSASETENYTMQKCLKINLDSCEI